MKKIANVNDIAWTIFCLPASTEDTCWEVFEPTLKEKKNPTNDHDLDTCFAFNFCK